MINLSERLSEFSYGYGVTREIEKAINAMGYMPTPFLPSLLHEKTLGFDVSFAYSGAYIFVQFKLGHQLTKYVRRDRELLNPPPILDRPFWRFEIDTADPDGQFRRLTQSQIDGAEVAYIAPKFSDWEQHADAHQNEALVDRSILISPQEIEQILATNGAAPGAHQVIYDKKRVYVRSEPLSLTPLTIYDLIDSAAERFGNLETQTDTQFESWSRSLKVFRPDQSNPEDGPIEQYERVLSAGPDEATRITGDQIFNQFLMRTDDRVRSQAATVGMQAWSKGIQMILISGLDE